MAILEGEVNATIVKTILDLGIYCYKIADRFNAGVPDIYVAGGNWIETKRVPYPRRYTGGNNVVRFMSWNQIKRCRRLTLSGDRCFVAACFLDPRTGKALDFMIAPFLWALKYPYWTHETVQQWGGQKWSRKNLDLSNMFDKTMPNNVNAGTWEDFLDTLEPQERGLVGNPLLADTPPTGYHKKGMDDDTADEEVSGLADESTDDVA